MFSEERSKKAISGFLIATIFVFSLLFAGCGETPATDTVSQEYSKGKRHGILQENVSSEEASSLSVNTNEHYAQMESDLPGDIEKESAERNEPSEIEIEVAQIVLEDEYEDGKEIATITAYSETGDELWKKDIGPYDAVQASRISEIGMANGMHYYIDDGTLVTLDPVTGNIIWENPDVGSGMGFAFDTDGTLYFCTYLQGTLFRISKDGTTENRLECPDDNYIWPYRIDIDGDILTIFCAMYETAFQVDKNTFHVIGNGDKPSDNTSLESQLVQLLPIDSVNDALEYTSLYLQLVGEHQEDAYFRLSCEGTTADGGFRIRGFDDMPTHIATLFQWEVMENGVINDIIMGGTVYAPS